MYLNVTSPCVTAYVTRYEIYCADCGQVIGRTTSSTPLPSLRCVPCDERDRAREDAEADAALAISRR